MSASVMSMMQTLARLSLEHIAAFARSVLAFFGTASQQARDALRALVATTTKSTKFKASYEATETSTVVAVAVIETDGDDTTASESESEVEVNDEVVDAQVADEDHATGLIVMIHEDRGDHDEDHEDGEEEDDQEDAQEDQQLEEDVNNGPAGELNTEEMLIVWPTITLDGVEADAAFDWTIQVYQSRLDGQQARGSVLLQRRLLGI